MKPSCIKLLAQKMTGLSSVSSNPTIAAAEISQGKGKRIGAIAVKKGMTALWDAVGTRIPCTVLQMEQVQVISHRYKPYTAVEVGCSNQLERRVDNALAGHFRKAGVQPKMKSLEFMVDPNRMADVGSTIKPSHFVPGQYLDVQAKTVGKGFAGVMKRHGFRGLRASHGVSISHRSHGSTGQHQDPGRVFPGKKMAGRMGHKLRSTQNLLLLRVDNKENLLYIKGCIPGSDGAFVRVQDSVKKSLGKNEFGVESVPTVGSEKLLEKLGLTDSEFSLSIMSRGGLRQKEQQA